MALPDGGDILMTSTTSADMTTAAATAMFTETTQNMSDSCNESLKSFNNEWVENQLYTSTLIDRSVTPIWYVIGITGNILSAIIWCRRRMRRNNSSAVYLAALSINDTLCLLFHIIIELQGAWKLKTFDYPFICQFAAFFTIATQYLAPTLVLGFSVERFIAVCYPYEKNKFCTISRALKVVCGIITGCILLASMQLYIWTYDPDLQQCVARDYNLDAPYTSLWYIWTWITEMLVFLVVPFIILVINILVMREVCRMSNPVVEAAINVNKHKPSKSAATNAMLLSVSFYIIFTTLPATLVYVLGSVFDSGSDCSIDIASDPQWHKHIIFQTVRKVIEEICLSHYACNFFIYAITGLEFRLELCRTFRQFRSGSLSRSTYAAENGYSDMNGGGGVGSIDGNGRGSASRHSLKSPDELHTFVTNV